MKLLLTVLVLIVLPTAWLSLLAGRSTQARELLLNRRLEAEAQQTLEEIGVQLQQALSSQVAVLAGEVGETVLAGADIRSLDAAVAPLQDGRDWQGQVYLFLNPWGFIHPPAAIPEQPEPADHYVLLSQELSIRLSRGEPDLFFGIGDRLYAFGKVGAAASLYVGFEVRQAGLLVLLEGILRQHATAHIEYRLLRAGAVQAASATAEVPQIEVRDTFSPEVPPAATILPSFARDTRRTEVLVAGHLRPPFDFIEIGAIAVNARDMYAARALQARLVRWSIFLLACVLLSSTAILLLLARRQAAQARLRSIFIAGLSHDIRTPVTAMRALAESLQQGRVTRVERQQQFFDSIVAECDRLQTLIERVLLFFRQEQGGYHRKQSVDLVALCQRVGNAFCARHRGRVDFQLDLPEGAVQMWADATALEQALQNLLENAWKYGRAAPGHPDEVVTVALQLRVEQGCWWRRCLVLVVEDGGPGIAVEERQRVFQRFYRGDSTQVQQAGGIGLGLALVREIVRGHGGRIRIERSALGGARFVLCFKPMSWRGGCGHLRWSWWSHRAGGRCVRSSHYADNRGIKK